MKKIYTWVAGGIVALLAATAFEFFTSTQPRNTSSTPEETSKSAPSQDRVNSAWAPTQAASTPTHPKTSPETREVLDSLLAQFNRTRSYRHFISASLKDARHGGLIYALAANAECETFRSSRESNKLQMTSNQALHSAALLEARCDTTAEESFQQLSAAMTSNGVRPDSDPLVAILMPRTFNESKDDSLRRARALLDSGDPIAMQSLIYLETQPSRDPGGDTGGYFDGQHYRSATERALLKDTWLLVQCSLGVSCGPESTATLLLCATRNWCGSDVAEALQIGRGPDGTFAQVQNLANSLLSAIRTKRAAAFVPAG
ncbi:hypothetical protein AACH06_24275 [Ideonella sp. DXS29W]|uniref:Uncharacterized protein n=1 Tax=Ideonella lacteola TaxID=2984193 RepID=A0ABU9BVG5_9BURK